MYFPFHDARAAVPDAISAGNYACVFGVRRLDAGRAAPVAAVAGAGAYTLLCAGARCDDGPWLLAGGGRWLALYSAALDLAGAGRHVARLGGRYLQSGKRNACPYPLGRAGIRQVCRLG